MADAQVSRSAEAAQPSLCKVGSRQTAPADLCSTGARLEAIPDVRGPEGQASGPPDHGPPGAEWGGALDTIKDNERIRDELLAFVLGIMMRGGNFREGTVDFLDSGTNHTCMDPMYFNKKALKRMYDGNCQANQNYWNNPDYTSSFRIFETWGSQSDNELCNYIKENFRPKEILGIEKAKAECLNPFKRPERVTKPKHLWEYDLAIKAMIIFAKQIEEEFIYA